MVTPEQSYVGLEPAGVIGLVTCGMLSLISVLGMTTILGISVLRKHRSSDKTLFVRTQVARYFFSLLICNLLQSVGALFNFAWIAQTGVEIGPICTAQATISQLGNVGTAIFSFVLATHTFSQLVLCCQWSDLTSYIILFTSWGLILLNSFVGYFIAANPEQLSYHGTTGHWCEITPAYPGERYASERLFILISAALTFILCALVILRLRGDFTISNGYKVHFRYSSKFDLDAAKIHTDDLTTGAKQMLPHPIAYTALVLPICITAFRTSSDTPIPFLATVSTAAVFVLSGFVNVVLFCTTRMALPGSWKQKFGIHTTLYSLPGGSSLTDMRRRRLSKAGRSTGTGSASRTLSVIVDKDVEIKYDEGGRTPSSPNLKGITLPIEPFQIHDGIQRDDSYSYHIRQISFPPPLCIRLEGDNRDEDLNAGAHPASKANIAWKVPVHRVYPYRGHESNIHGPTPGFEARSPVYPLAVALPPVNAHTRNSSSSSISTYKTAADQIRRFWW